MSKANPLRGTEWIIVELEEFEIEVSRGTGDKYLVRVRLNPSPSWKAFLKNEAKVIAGIDFFTVATVNFRVLNLIVLGEEHLRILLRSYFDYYHRS